MVLMNGNEYSSGSVNTNGMKAGTFLQKTSSLQ